MKRNATSQERISTENLRTFTDAQPDSAEAAVMLAWWGLLAEMADAIGNGDNIYMTIGANRARTALVITLNDGEQKTFAAGSDLIDAITKALEAF